MSRRRPTAATKAAAAGVGAAAALLPSLAAAQQSRALDTPDDAVGTVLVTVGAVVALFAVGSLGYLYLRLRGLEWGFQEKELPPEPGSGGHH
jgi:hypothetical protein